MKKPRGVTLYFDRIEPLRDLNDEELGRVFRGLWAYAESGEAPALPERLIPYWRVVKPSIDAGRKHYMEISVKNRYNRYIAEVKKAGKEPPPFWEWWCRQRDFDDSLFNE